LQLEPKTIHQGFFLPITEGRFAAEIQTTYVSFLPSRFLPRRINPFRFMTMSSKTPSIPPAPSVPQPAGISSWLQPVLAAMRPIIAPFWGRSHLVLLTHPFDFVARNRDGLRELVRCRETFRDRDIRLILGAQEMSFDIDEKTRKSAIAGLPEASSYMLPRVAALIDRNGVLRASLRYQTHDARSLDEMVRLAALIHLD
jgi:hypothetical protein